MRPDGRGAAPIPLGHPGLARRPLAIGPDRVPVVSDPATASESPELAVLSAMAHGGHPEREKVLNALLTGLRTLDGDRANLYIDVVLAVLPSAARACLEELMRLQSGIIYEYQSDYARHYFGQGEAKALLTVLATRGIEVPEQAKERITSCTDLDQLQRWVERAVTISHIDELW